MDCKNVATLWFSENKHTYHLEDFTLLSGFFCLAFCFTVKVFSLIISEGFGRVTLNVFFKTECLKNGLSYGYSNKRIGYVNYVIHKTLRNYFYKSIKSSLM